MIFTGIPQLDRSNPLNKGLVLDLPAYEKGGIVAHDVSGYNNHGTLVNGTTWLPGPYGGYGFGFDGASSQYVSTSVAIDSSIGFTLAVWMRPTIESFIIMSRSTTFRWFFTTANRVIVQTTSNSTRFQTSDEAAILNEWHWYGFTCQGLSGTFYLDGQPLTLSASPTVEIGPQIVEDIGRRGDSTFYFSGQLAYPRIYNRALSAAEVVELYSQYSSLYYNFSQATVLLAFHKEIYNETGSGGAKISGSNSNSISVIPIGGILVNGKAKESKTYASHRKLTTKYKIGDIVYINEKDYTRQLSNIKPLIIKAVSIRKYLNYYKTSEGWIPEHMLLSESDYKNYRKQDIAKLENYFVKKKTKLSP